MSFTCANCDNKADLKFKKTTINYTAGGLPNVTLTGVKVATCNKCGESYYNFGNIIELHRLIIETLAKKEGLLTGAEIRFIRKHLGYDTQTFAAKILGVDKSHLSRLENADTPTQSPTLDNLVRATGLASIPDRNYKVHDVIADKRSPIDRFIISLSKMAVATPA